MRKMTYNRILLMIFSVLMMLGFFFLPYFHSSLMTIGGALGGLLGAAGDEVSGALAELANISMFRFLYMLRVGSRALTDIGIDLKQVGMVEFLLKYCSSGLLPLVILIFAIFGGMVTKIGAGISSGLLLTVYLVQILLFPKLAADAKYSVSLFYFALPVFAVLCLVMALLEKGRTEGTGYDVGPAPYPPTDRSDLGRASNRDPNTGTYYVPSGGGSDWMPTHRDLYDRAGGVIQPFPATGRGRLTMVQGSMQGCTIPMNGGDTVTIGRNPAGCNLILPEESVSRVHCHITYDAGSNAYQVMDVSSFGVYDGIGRQLPPNQQVWLKAGDVLRIGTTENMVQLG